MCIRSPAGPACRQLASRTVHTLRPGWGQTSYVCNGLRLIGNSDMHSNCEFSHFCLASAHIRPLGIRLVYALRYLEIYAIRTTSCLLRCVVPSAGSRVVCRMPWPTASHLCCRRKVCPGCPSARRACSLSSCRARGRSASYALQMASHCSLLRHASQPLPYTISISGWPGSAATSPARTTMSLSSIGTRVEAPP
jgi:hypothetical protein